MNIGGSEMNTVMLTYEWLLFYRWTASDELRLYNGFYMLERKLAVEREITLFFLLADARRT